MRRNSINILVRLKEFAESTFKPAYIKSCVENVAKDLACFLENAKYSHCDITAAIDELHFKANFCAMSLSSAIDDIRNAAPVTLAQDQNFNAYTKCA